MASAPQMIINVIQLTYKILEFEVNMHVVACKSQERGSDPLEPT